MRPEILDFRYETFGRSPSYFCVLRGDTLWYRSGSLFAEEKHLRPVARQWQVFARQLQTLRIWAWADAYDAPALDGFSWRLELEWDGRSVTTWGSNAYPDPDDLGQSVQEGPSPPFHQLTAALNELCGVEVIQL